MSMGLTAEFLGGESAGKNAHYAAQSGIGSGLKIERRISDAHDLRNAIYLRQLHCMEEHKRRGSSSYHIVAGNCGYEKLLPIKAAKDGVGHCTIEPRCSGHQITGFAHFKDRFFGARNRWHGPIDFNELRSKFVVDSGGQFFPVTIRRSLLIYKMANDFTFGSSAPPADVLGRRVNSVVAECSSKQFRDIPTILDERASDIENNEPNGWQ